MKKINPFWQHGQRLLNNLSASVHSIPLQIRRLGGGLVIVSVITLSLWTDNPDSFEISQQSQLLDLPSENTTNQAPTIDHGISKPVDVWQQAIVKKGDSLALIFARLGIKPVQLHHIMKSGKSVRELQNIKPGQEINIRANKNGEVLELLHIISPTRSFSVKREDNTFKTQLVEREPEIRIRHAHGSIESSLFLAAQKAGIEDAMIMNLISIFGWDIDFALDIRQKDSFTVLYEDIFIEGEKVRTGNIVAAEFTNQGKKYRAVRYANAQGHTDYYDENGRSMRKAFLRTPVSYSRISSRFGKRHHPVLNRLKLHKGVDYAASRGTPVKATGSGKIVYRGWKGGYGKTIVIRHAGKYSTLYAHMSGYQRGLRNGTRVKQGQTIGYVGSTGRATGPHLHYEFRVNGAHRNPLRVRLPDANPIHRKYKQDFIEKSNGFFAQLDAISNSMVALNN
ncbi:MAG: peptidoglycan DD-metalloendopeptidase family protein [Gammaproteobacteria bacterium]|nr:peptidoglycan DD-metalloendopeptidase family protein [Gammaproteobacteria bacterium]